MEDIAVDKSAHAGAAAKGGRSDAALRYGFVGLGHLGAKLAKNLIGAGFHVTVCDLDERAAAPLVARGATWAKFPDEAARGADAVITCLPSPAVSERVLSGPNGLLATLKPGGTWIEMSTVGIDDIRSMAARAAEHGIATLEAPMTGGVHRAAAGTMTVLVGGAREVLDRHRPAFEAMCGPLFHMGELGSASIIKVISNMLAFDHLIAAGEAMLLAKKAGLDMRACYEAIKASSGTSIEFNTVMPVILSGTFDTSFSLALAVKDMRIAMDLARQHGLELALSQQVAALYERGLEEYGSDAWSANVVRTMERAAGTELRGDGFATVMTEGGRIDEQDH